MEHLIGEMKVVNCLELAGELDVPLCFRKISTIAAFQFPLNPVLLFPPARSCSALSHSVGESMKRTVSVADATAL